MHLTYSAARVLQRVVDDGLSLDQAFDEVLPGLKGNPGALKEIGFGGCRHYIRIDSMLSVLLDRPVRKKDRIVHFILVAAIYQLQYMDAPDHAVVNEAVRSLDQTRQSWAGRFVNGVLRNFIRSRDDISAATVAEHVQYAFPEQLFDVIKNDWPDHYIAIAEASNERPPLTLRVNLQRITRADFCNMLGQEKLEFETTPESETGVVLSNPMTVADIPGFHEGLVSVQDESAQLVLPELDLQQGLRILDGCAAPGGKTCLMLESDSSLSVVAVDVPQRTDRIRENLHRLGLTATVIDADLLSPDRWWDGQPFDRILLDVPCSGTGVIRRHPDIRHRRQPGDIAKFQAQQVEMLRCVWPMLNPGGRLLYVTCSILHSENDGAIEKFIGDIDNFELQSLDHVSGESTRYGKQRLPGVHSGDGFYFSRIGKTGE